MELKLDVDLLELCKCRIFVLRFNDENDDNALCFIWNGKKQVQERKNREIYIMNSQRLIM